MSSTQEERERLLRDFRLRHGLDDLPVENLNLALTHRSYSFEQSLGHDNERLEFLGDAVLSVIASEHLYQTFESLPEGDLSKLRARLVSRTMLGKRAGEMGLGPLLLLGIGEDKTGGTRRRSVLGGALEALVGVIYLHSGHNRAREFTLQHLLGPLLAQTEADSAYGDFKSELQEWSQRTHNCLPTYHRMEERGPDHAKTFMVEVEVNGERLAQGSGPRIKTAENEAARQALLKVAREGKKED